MVIVGREGEPLASALALFLPVICPVMHALIEGRKPCGLS